MIINIFHLISKRNNVKHTTLLDMFYRFYSNISCILVDFIIIGHPWCSCIEICFSSKLYILFIHSTATYMHVCVTMYRDLRHWYRSTFSTECNWTSLTGVKHIMWITIQQLMVDKLKGALSLKKAQHKVANKKRYTSV